MKKHIVRALAAMGLAAVLLTGCDKDNTPPPTPLSKVAPSEIKVNIMWRNGNGLGADGQFLKLGPAVNAQQVVTVGYRGTVTAYNRQNGNALWSVKLNAPLSSTPTIAGNRVFVGANNGKFFALNAANGSTVWKAQLSGALQAAPAVANNIVVVHTLDGHVTALNETTGKQMWMHDGSTPDLIQNGDSAPVIDNGTVFVGFDNGIMMAFNLQNGQVLWQRPIAIPNGASQIERMVDINGTPKVEDGVLYAASYHGNAVGLAVNDGRLLWQHPVSTIEAIAVGDGRVFVTTDVGNVLALDQQTGREVWVQKALQHRFVSAPALVGNDVVVGDYAGYVHWLSSSNGKILARIHAVSVAISAQPVVYGQTVYVTSDGGQVVALQAAK